MACNVRQMLNILQIYANMDFLIANLKIILTLILLIMTNIRHFLMNNILRQLYGHCYPFF
jgi:hypothetical protein